MIKRDITNVNVHPVMAVTMIEMNKKHLLPVELEIVDKSDEEGVNIRLSSNWEDINAKTWLINKSAFLAQQRMESYAPEAWDDMVESHLTVLQEYIEKQARQKNHLNEEL